MRVLIIEDETIIAEGVKSACASEGFVCQIEENGAEGLEMIRFYDYDIIVLDLMLPDINGYDVLNRVRTLKKDTPIIILSGISATDEKVKCLSSGADDYLTKPFSRAELLARMYALIRRTKGYSSSIVEVGPLALDLNNRVVTIYNQELPLTSKEYSILELLALKKGAIVAKETFLNHMYSGMDEPDLKIVDVFICKLRKKMAQFSGGINFIETVWGRGYSMRDNSELLDKKEFNQLKAG